ncbi:MAG TPA: HlyD family secretion protein [Caulobacteraceae bacterium]|nr:HlyD family secretion protein [Caulobacteraceae bacterium]
MSEAGRQTDGFWRRWRWPLMIGGPVLILGAVVWFMLNSGKTEETDDAYVQVAKAPISTSISGRVIEIDVRENQHVKAGQVLFKLDPVDITADLDRATAQLGSANVQLSALRAQADQARVAVQTALQTEAYAVKEAARQKALVQAGVSSAQQASEAEHNAQLAHQQVATARQQLATAEANLGTGGVGAPPSVLQAQAAIKTARLNLAHTVVIAPQDGIVTRVDQLQVGAYVNASQTLFWLLSGEPWIEANFKESQLAKMRVGQPASIHIDAYGDEAIRGHVASFSPGTGAAFSVLPAQNGTGNWVKVVQRLPVRIAFDKTPPEMAGRAGLSAKVTVDVRPEAPRRVASGS